MPEIDRLVILGANGDLSTRLLLPSIARVMEAGHLPESLQIVGSARAEMTGDEYRRVSAENLAEFAPEVDQEARDRVVKMLRYLRADSTDADALSPAFKDGRPAVIYLALPPGIYAGTIDALDRAGLPEGSRIVIEKPFGEDFESAVELNRQLKRVFPEEAIYRIDHFTALQAVEAIIGLRFGNRMFEPLWNREHIQQVDIIWDDTLALEGRAGYYDTAGALKDMVQNHLLQVLMLLAMEQPGDLDARALRDCKVDVLKAIRLWSTEEAARNSYRARYTAGESRGRPVPDYVDEDRVDPANGTETYSEVCLRIDNPRWEGVPFVLRSGKAQGRDRRVVNVTFREIESSAYGAGRPNVLQLQMLPDRLYLGMMLTQPDDFTRLRPVHFGLDLPEEILPAHGALLLDVLRGDQTRFVRDDEAEESWRVMQPFLDAWADDLTPLEEYPAGTDVQTGFTADPGTP